MLAVALIALGFLARSFLGAPAAGAAGSGTGRAAARLFWLSTATLALWALVLSGSLGAGAGLAAGLGGAGLFYALFAPNPRARRAGVAAIAVLSVAALALAALLLHRSDVPAPAGGPAAGLPLLERATDPGSIGLSFDQRLDNWRAGLQAFGDRPLLGWGPENHLVAASGYDRAAAATNRGRDRAHNMAVEKAVTEGVPGLLAWLALWGLSFVVIVRAARRLAPPEQALAVFAGAALLGWLVLSLTFFYGPASWLQHVLLLAFAAHLELGMRRSPPSGSAAAAAALAAALRRPAARGALAAGPPSWPLRARSPRSTARIPGPPHSTAPRPPGRS